jgi:hypothetical protein
VVVVLSVVALLLAFIAMASAVRAWASGSGGVRRRRVPRLPRAVLALALLDVVAGAVLALSLVPGTGSPRKEAQQQEEEAQQQEEASSASQQAQVGRRPTSNGAAGRPTRRPTSTAAANRPITRWKSTGPAPPARGHATRVPATPPAKTSAHPRRAKVVRRPVASPRLGPPPVLRAVSPASGAAGEVVTLLGNRLFSPDGRIEVTFGAVPAPVACPTQTTCHVRVPPAPKGRFVVAVTVVTQSGPSNAVAFRYS